jgi:hypothetical protein
MGGQSDVLPGGTGPSAAIAFPSLAQLLPNASDFHAFVNASLDQWAQEAVNAGAAVNAQGLLKQYELQVSNIFNDAAPVFEMLVPFHRLRLHMELIRVVQVFRHRLSTPATWHVRLAAARTSQCPILLYSLISFTSFTALFARLRSRLFCICLFPAYP